MNTAEAKVPNKEGNWQSIEIYVFSNGQQYSPPRKYHLRAEELNWWDATLNQLARSHYGIQHPLIYLYTTDGRLVEGPLELRDGMAYVAVEPPEQFIDAGYEKYLIRATRSWEKRQARKNNPACEHDQPCCICPVKEECKPFPTACCICPEKEGADMPECRSLGGHIVSPVLAKAGAAETLGQYGTKPAEYGPKQANYGPRLDHNETKSSEHGNKLTEPADKLRENETSSCESDRGIGAESEDQPGEQINRHGEYVSSSIKSSPLSDQNHTIPIEYETGPIRQETEPDRDGSWSNIAEPKMDRMERDVDNENDNDHSSRTSLEDNRAGEYELPAQEYEYGLAERENKMAQSSPWVDEYGNNVSEQGPDDSGKIMNDRIPRSEERRGRSGKTLGITDDDGTRSENRSSSNKHGVRAASSGTKVDENIAKSNNYANKPPNKRGRLAEHESKATDREAMDGAHRISGGEYRGTGGEHSGRGSELEFRTGGQGGNENEHRAKSGDTGRRSGDHERTVDEQIIRDISQAVAARNLSGRPGDNVGNRGHHGVRDVVQGGRHTDHGVRAGDPAGRVGQPGGNKTKRGVRAIEQRNRATEHRVSDYGARTDDNTPRVGNQGSKASDRGVRAGEHGHHEDDLNRRGSDQAAKVGEQSSRGGEHVDRGGDINVRGRINDRGAGGNGFTPRTTETGTRSSVGSRNGESDARASTRGRGGEPKARLTSGGRNGEPTARSSLGGRAGEARATISSGGRNGEPEARVSIGGKGGEPRGRLNSGGKSGEPVAKASPGGRGGETRARISSGGRNGEPEARATPESRGGGTRARLSSGGRSGEPETRANPGGSGGGTRTRLSCGGRSHEPEARAIPGGRSGETRARPSTGVRNIEPGATASSRGRNAEPEDRGSSGGRGGEPPVPVLNASLRGPVSSLGEPEHRLGEPGVVKRTSGGEGGALGFSYISEAQQHVRRSNLSSGKPSKDKKRWSATEKALLNRGQTPYTLITPIKSNNDNPVTDLAGKAPTRLSNGSFNEGGSPKVVPKYPHKLFAPTAVPPPIGNFNQVVITRESNTLTKITSNHKSLATDSVPIENVIGDKEIIIVSANLFRNPESEITSVRLDSDRRHVINTIRDSSDEAQTEQIRVQHSIASIAINEEVQTLEHQFTAVADKHGMGITTNTQLIRTSSGQRDDMVATDDTEENYISIINKGDVVNLKMNIEVRNAERLGNSGQKNERRSRSLTNVTRTEKESQISFDDDMYVQSKSLQSLLNNDCFRGCGFEGRPKVVVVQCACCAHGLKNPPRCDTACNDSKKYVVLVPNPQQGDSENKCTCDPTCQSYNQKMHPQIKKHSSHHPVKKTTSNMSLDTVTVRESNGGERCDIHIATTNSTVQTEDQKSEISTTKRKVSITEDSNLRCDYKRSLSQTSVSQTQVILTKDSNCLQECPDICSHVTSQAGTQASTQLCPTIQSQECPLACPQFKLQGCSQACPQVQLQGRSQTSTQAQLQGCLSSCPQVLSQGCPQGCPQIQSQGFSQMPQPQTQGYSQLCPQSCQKTQSQECSQAYPQTHSFQCPQTCPQAQVTPQSYPQVQMQVCPQTCQQSQSQVYPQTLQQSQSQVSPQAYPQSWPKKCPQSCSQVQSQVCPQTCPQAQSVVGLQICPQTCPQLQAQVRPPQTLQVQSQVHLQVLPPLQVQSQALQVQSRACSTTCPKICPKIQSQAFTQIRVQLCDSHTQTDWCSVLLEARRHENGRYSFHLPPLNLLQYYTF